MRGLVSFTLFGDQEMYLHGAVENAKLWKQGPLDVDTIFYVGESVPDRTLTALRAEGAKVVPWEGPEDQTATFWRYEALKEDYDYHLFRDVDSRPYEREYIVLDEWLEGHYPFHVIRDHPYHGVPILAGLFGVKRPLREFISGKLGPTIPEDFYKVVKKACNHIVVNYESNDFYQIDQWWLRLQVYPLLRNKVMAHDSFFGFERPRYKFALPPRGVEGDFIAEGFNEFEEPRHPQHRECFAAWPRRSIRR
jgi:hypothetical protein